MSFHHNTVHDPRAVTQVGPGGRSASFAYCTCGWQGPTRRKRAEADQDAQEHTKENQ